MAPGAIFSLFAVDKDADQLLLEDADQLNDIEQISEEMQHFEQELHQEAPLSSLPLRILRTEKNDRDRYSKDLEATTSKKKYKINEDIVNGNEIVEEEKYLQDVEQQ